MRSHWYGHLLLLLCVTGMGGCDKTKDSRYFGNEVRPPVNSLDALKKIVVPRFRNRVSGLRFVKDEPLPSLAAALGNASRIGEAFHPTSEGAKIRIEYRKGERILSESLDFNPNIGSNVNWQKMERK